MRILFVNSLFPTPGDTRAIGGAETFSVRLVRGLRERGHEISIVRSGTGSRGEIDHTAEGIEVRSMPRRNLYAFSDGRAHNAASRMAWHMLEDRGRIAPDFAAALDAAKPDLVHTNNVAGLTTDVWRVAHAAGLPVLHTLHDYYLICPRVLRFARGERCTQTCSSCGLFSKQRRQAVRYVDRVVGVSQRMLDIHRAEGLFVDTPWEVILNKPPPPRRSATKFPRPLGTRPIFGYIGRQAQEKGIFELLQAFVTLPPGAAGLVIAGAIEPDVQAWVRQHAPRPDDVVFTGFTTQEFFFPTIDVAVIPSLWEEPCSMGAGEAFSFGVPALGSKRGGIPEMLDGGRLGWLFEPGTGELATLLARLVADPAEIGRKATIVRERMETDTEDRLVSSYADTYAAVLERGRVLA